MQDITQPDDRSAALYGLVSAVKRFAIHDGPGIRTLVILKGCPLRCLWCSSPETQSAFPDLLYAADACQRCGKCLDACPAQAILPWTDGGLRIDRAKCTHCGQCAEICPNHAWEFVGKYMTVEELLGEVARDSCYYRRSHGGITLGGGEPTLQHAFVLEFLKRVNRLYIHTAMETCGHVKGENLTMLLPLVDLVYIDIKHMNPAIHKKLTGVSNDLILENARRAARVRPIIIRIPTVPGCNDSEENILATGRFAASLGEHLQRVELLPYHALGVQTYRKLGTRYELDDLKSPSATHLERLKGIIESCQITAQIGG